MPYHPLFLIFDQSKNCNDNETLYAISGLSIGFGWWIAYAACVYFGFKHKTFYEPIIAICLNVTWEYYICLYLAWQVNWEKPLYQILTITGNGVCIVFDTLIVVTLVLYGPKYYPNLSKPYFYAVIIFLLISSLIWVIIWHTTFDPTNAYSAFADTYFESILFFYYYYQRYLLPTKEERGIYGAWIVAIGIFIGNTGAVVFSGYCGYFDDPSANLDSPTMIMFYAVTVVFGFAWMVLCIRDCLKLGSTEIEQEVDSFGEFAKDVKDYTKEAEKVIDSLKKEADGDTGRVELAVNDKSPKTT